ncbi:glyoxalase [Nocardia wallacei]|uniref:glyoxalase n=1 Tax=Nocardia wallacei TaxID=480035 RepID=UPI0024587261|nr:glyoxalase [Nocardia wallacei]
MAISIPVLWSGDLPVTLEFYRALGYKVTDEQSRPYAYAVLHRDGYQIHLGPTPKQAGSAEEAYVGCLVMIDDAARRHAEFSAALREHYGRVPARGAPRITRFRPGQPRFTVVDPAGNSIIYIEHGEPDLEYGGSRALAGLARVLDNARILRDFKSNEAESIRVLEVGLRRFGHSATPLERGRACAMLADMHSAAGDVEQAAGRRRELAALALADDELAALRAEFPGACEPGEN